MSNDNVIPLHVHASPELRARIFAEVIGYVAAVPAQVTEFTLVSHVLKALNKREEEIGPEIMSAIFLLVRAGVLTCNRFDPVTSDMVFSADTCVGLGPAMMAYIWAEEASHGAETDN